ncbi:MAG: CHASE domain-containing protein, partial [Candidatus Omnitrophica bacterium]|nr:CHASE domain-containing protein [Candidatus Omnitrophota bacterium]
MQEFFLSQIDYFSFVHGLAFILLAAFGSLLHRKQSQDIPWHWLALFAATYGLHEWADLLALTFKDSVPFQWIRLAVMAASFIFLMEFGRATCQRLGYVKVGRWIYLPLLVVALWGVKFSWPGLDASVRYALGSLGALWAGLALYRLSVQPARGQAALRWAAVGFVLYAVAIGFSFSFLHTLIAILVALAIGFYDEAQEDGWGKYGFGSLVSVLLIFLVAGWFSVNWAGAHEALSRRQELLRFSQQIAQAIDYRQVQMLNASASDIDSDVYSRLKEQLQILRKNMVDIRFIYLMRKVKGQAVFLADSELAGSQDESPPGQILEEAPPELLATFASGQSTVEGPSADRWGSWLSAYTPLNDHRTGKAVAILGVDQDTHDYNLSIARKSGEMIFILGLLCVMAILGLMYVRCYLDIREGSDGKATLLRFGMLGAVVLLGVTLTGLSFLRERGRSLETFQTIFLQRASVRAQAVAQALLLQKERLEGLSHFFENAGQVQYREFNHYVKPIVEGDPLQALEWVPRVSRQERADYEARARRDGLEGFEVRELNADGKLMPATERDEYFPVYFVAPLKGNAAALGFDVASDPERRRAMEMSRDEGRTVVPAPVRFVQALTNSTGILAFTPVYAEAKAQKTVDERRMNLRGFIIGVYRADEFLKVVYSALPAEGLACLIEDPQAPAASRILYRHKIRIGTVDWDKPLMKYESPLSMSGREWRITIIPGSSFIDAYLSRGYIFILPIGLVLTGLLAALLNLLMVRRFQAEMLVGLRTIEKEKYFNLVNNLTIGVYRHSLGAAPHFLEVNPALLSMFEGDMNEELLQRNISDLFQDASEGRGFIDRLEESRFLRDEVVRFKTLKGDVFWGSMTVVRKQGEDGDVYFDGT